MLLHRYLASHALETLQEGRLKVSLVSSFNDPFECLFGVVGQMTRQKANAYLRRRYNEPDFLDEVIRNAPHLKLKTRKAARRYIKANRKTGIEALASGFDKIKQSTREEQIKITDDSLRVVCFSASTATPYSEILMWSHYANKHHGILIGFEFPALITGKFRIERMQYSRERVAVDISDDVLSDPVQTALKLSLKTKSIAWEYENEYRLLTTRDVTTRDHTKPGFEFIPFDKAWVKEVTFGTRCPADVVVECCELLKHKYPRAIRQRAKYHPTEYALEYTPV